MLRDEAMIVRLNISQWTGRKFDKRITEDVAREYAVSPESGRYNKLLLSKEATAEITAAVSAARTFHYNNTRAWDDNNGRLLPVENFNDYRKEMSKIKTRFDEAVARFVENYPDYREAARKALNGMFREADYPGVREIAHKFNLSTDIEPVPSTADFRVSVSNRDMDRIRKQLEKDIERRMAEGTKDLFVRLNEVVSSFADTMATEGKRFWDSKVENIVEVVDLLAKLNVTKDPKLEEMRILTKRKLCALEPDNLRGDSKARKQAAKDANAILKKMSGYIGATA